MSNSEPLLSEFLTKEELAAELRRNPRTLDRWDVLGVGPPRTCVGRQVLYRRASVQKWLVAQEQSAVDVRYDGRRPEARDAPNLAFARVRPICKIDGTSVVVDSHEHRRHRDRSSGTPQSHPRT